MKKIIQKGIMFLILGLSAVALPVGAITLWYLDGTTLKPVDSSWTIDVDNTVTNLALNAGSLIYGDSTGSGAQLASSTDNKILTIDDNGYPAWEDLTITGYMEDTDINTLAKLNAWLPGESVASTSVETLSSLTSIGTIGTGTWEATDVGVAYGGTGASTFTSGELLVGNGTSAITSTSTIGANLIPDSYLKNDGDTGTGTYDFSGATLKQHTYPGFSFPPGLSMATTTTATTTIPIGTAYTAQSFGGAECWSGSGTIVFAVTDGTNDSDYISATTTVSRFAFTTGNTFTAGEKRYIEIGAMTSDYLTCSFDITINN